MANRNTQGFPSPEEDPRFHDTYQFLRRYRDATYSLKVVVHQMEHQFKLQYDNDIDKFLDSIYAAGADLTGSDIEQRAKSIARSNQMLKLLESSIDLLRNNHKHGEQYYWILYYAFLSPQEMKNTDAKVVEWYGGKEQFLSVANNPISKEAAESYNQQFDNLLYKLAAKKVCSPDSSEVRELVSEYGFLMKQLSQIKKEHGLMVAQAQYYRNEKIKPMIDEKYGNGTAEFFAQAFEAFYKDK